MKRKRHAIRTLFDLKTLNSVHVPCVETRVLKTIFNLYNFQTQFHRKSAWKLKSHDLSRTESPEREKVKRMSIYS